MPSAASSFFHQVLLLALEVMPACRKIVRPAANVDADRALISFKEMPITPVEANRQALEVARAEIGGLAVERAALINDSERRQDPVLLDVVEFDRFIWEPG